MRHRRPHRPPIVALLALGAGLVAAGAEARAQLVHRLRFHGELGLGAMVSDHARSTLGYDGLGGEGTLRVGVRAVGPLSVQLGLANWLWLHRGDGPNGRLLAVDFGLRVDVTAGRVVAPWIDLNVGPGFSESLVRAHLNAGLGIDFNVVPAVAVGPFVRYGRYFQTTAETRSNAGNEDAQFVVAGLHLSVRVPEPPPPPPPPVVRDTDGDGVLDPDDLCVDVPQGDHPDPARRGCPLTDRDRDGVFDPDDVCPDVPMGDVPDPLRRGCPDPDRDGDGLTDSRDRCPDEPMAPRPDPDRPGCRRPEAVINLGEIFFERRIATIAESAANLRTLNEALALFTAHDEIELFSVEGHADSREDREFNLRLSQGRAESVRDWLVTHGINTARMVPVGYGESCPIDRASTEEAWTRNRRVLFVIARRAGAPEPGARFGCEAAAGLVPTALGGRGETHGHHGRHRRGRHGQ